MRLHTDAVTKNRAAGNAAGGIDRKDAYGFSFTANGASQRIHERALPCPGRSGNTGDNGMPGVRRKLADQRGGFARAIFNACGGASQRARVTGGHTRGNLGGGLGNPVRHQSLSNWRAMTRRWISLVPSPMVQSFTSR